MQFRWAIIDIETTGLSIVHDRITEISVLLLTEQGIESSWARLINPKCPIPKRISQLTGITDEMVSQAPCFGAIAEELIALLDGAVLVAHNARFDFGFLKNAFKSEGLSFRTPILCTLKLFKMFYPELAQYNLRSLAEYHHIVSPHAHRAGGDVHTLYLLLEQAFQDWSRETIINAAKRLYKKASVPSKLTTDIQSIPNSPGVYLFYAENSSLPLYIGKSILLRQRVLSHFQADHTNAKEFKMAQQVVRVDIIPTAGELSALLLESMLIKEKCLCLIGN